MRTLRILTTVSLLIGMGLMVSLGVLMVQRPTADAPKAELKAHARGMAYHIVGILASLTTSATCALLMFRKIRREYSEEQLKNLVDLVATMPTRKSNDNEK